MKVDELNPNSNPNSNPNPYFNSMKSSKWEKKEMKNLIFIYLIKSHVVLKYQP